MTKKADASPFEFAKLLDWSPESVLEKVLPSVEDVEDTLRLRRIAYRALYHLKNTRQRSKTVILAAWEDLFTLRDWCIQAEVERAVAAFTESLEKERASTTAYVDIERYRANLKQSTEMHYLGLVDALRQIILQVGLLAEAPCSLKSDHFTNAEFLCVAALHQVSMALKKLQRLRMLLANEQDTRIDRSLLWNIKQVYHDTLEAQSAIELAHLHDKLTSSDFEAAYKAMLAEQQRQRSLRGNEARWDKHKQRREKVWELFNETKKQYPHLNDTKVIAHIIDAVQQFSDEIHLKRLKVGSEEESIYKMIYQKRLELKNKKPT